MTPFQCLSVCQWFYPLTDATGTEAGLDLYDYRARFYDPLVGTFISPDTIVPQPENPAAWNRYGYVYGNPVRYSDPSGNVIVDLNKFEYMRLDGNDGDLPPPLPPFLPPHSNKGDFLSVGYTGGFRLFGIGPVGKISADLVTDSEGGVQFYLTRGVGYYYDGLYRGDKNVVKLVKKLTQGDPIGSKLPQSDTWLLPTGGYAVVKGVIEYPDQTWRVFRTGDYGGLARNIDIDVSMYTFSWANSFNPDLGSEGQFSNLRMSSAGLSWSELPSL